MNEVIEYMVHRETCWKCKVNKKREKILLNFPFLYLPMWLWDILNKITCMIL